MTDVLPVLAAGLVSGAAYALLALGIVIIFRSTDTVNFAIGDMATFGVYVAAEAVSRGVPVPLALPIAIGCASLMGIGTERLIIRRLGTGRSALFVALVATIGIGLLIHALIGVIWGFRPSVLQPLVPGSVQVLGVVLTWNKVIATGVAIVAMIGVASFFRFSLTGTAMRATAEDHTAARIIGLRPTRIAALAWGIGCGLAALAAFFLAADSSVNADLTVSPLFRAFAGVFFGGLTSMPGAAVGGFMIGMLDNLAGRYVSANYRDTIVFAVIVAVLFLRPSGFMGAARKERV
jgi:branched-chain amino acid transport system permease protein